LISPGGAGNVLYDRGTLTSEFRTVQTLRSDFVSSEVPELCAPSQGKQQAGFPFVDMIAAGRFKRAVVIGDPLKWRLKWASCSRKRKISRR
jgi:hypothetical protein